MKQIFLLFAILLLVLVGGFAIQRFLDGKPLVAFDSNSKVIINGQEFQLEVATTAKQKEVGLSEKNSLAENQGMIFPFDKPDYYYFWMKNMKIPIDIIYVRDGKIVHVAKNQQPPENGNQNPPLIAPGEPADTVIEIKAGLAEKYNMKRGDEVKKA